MPPNEPAIATAADFRAAFDVSRETIDRLSAYLALLERWNPRINLVGGRTLPEAWSRHFADSAQLLALAPPAARSWLDLGAGAGFPGAVVAILAAETRPDLAVTLVESDGRKAAFLGAVARETGTPFAVLAERIESLPPQASDILSARALAPLAELLGHAEKHRRPEGTCLFPKGRSVHKEIADAALTWRFDPRIHRSRTDPDAAILEIGAFARA